MSSAIVLPTLTKWVENGITAIIQAKSAEDQQNAIDAFLSQNANIVINGVQTSRADFVSQIAGQNFDEQGSSINFVGAVAVPATPGDNFTAGSVGVFYTASVFEAIRVLGGPVTKQITASLNVVVEQDPSIPPPPPSPIHGFFDGRRVSALNEIRLQVTPPPTLPTVPANAGTS